MLKSSHQGEGGKDLAYMLWEGKDALFKIDYKLICMGHCCKKVQKNSELRCIH
jgi:hypothetical protein